MQIQGENNGVLEMSMLKRPETRNCSLPGDGVSSALLLNRFDQLLIIPHLVHITIMRHKFFTNHHTRNSKSGTVFTVSREAAVGVFQINEQRAKFVNEVRHLTRFIEKVDSELPSSLMMLIRQLLKMKNT